MFVEVLLDMVASKTLLRAKKHFVIVISDIIDNYSFNWRNTGLINTSCSSELKLLYLSFSHQTVKADSENVQSERESWIIGLTWLEQRNN